MKELILLVEVETGTRRPTRHSLEQAGYVVRESTDVPVLEDALRSRPSLLLLAAALPGQSGLDLCRSIRREPLLSGTRIVLLLDSDSEVERMAGRKAGADDCITTALSPSELVRRIQTVLHGHEHTLAASLEPTDIVIDRAAMKLSIRGNEVTTTSLEFRLVDYLAQHRGRVCSRDVLLDAVWGETEFVMPRSVDACIRRLRDKIEPNRSSPTYLKTVRGIGYRLDANPAWPTSRASCTCRACSPSTGSSGFFDHDKTKARKATAEV